MPLVLWTSFAGLLGLAILILLLRPWPAVRWLAQASPRVVFFRPMAQPLIALTIDDSPHAIGSPLILDVLARHQVRATFFIITEQIAGNEALLRQMAAQGHELGNHGTRDGPSVLQSREQFEHDVRTAHAALAPFTDHVQWFRPGMAWYTPAMLDVLELCQYRCALGSVWPYDSFVPLVSFSTAYILANVAPGAVVILHDSAPAARTTRTLERVIPALRARGYRFVTLSELMS